MKSLVEFVVIAAATIALLAGPASAEDMSAEQRATASWMIEQARAWADQACGGKWVLSDQDSSAGGRQARATLSGVD